MKLLWRNKYPVSPKKTLTSPQRRAKAKLVNLLSSLFRFEGWTCWNRPQLMIIFTCWVSKLDTSNEHEKILMIRKPENVGPSFIESFSNASVGTPSESYPFTLHTDFCARVNPPRGYRSTPRLLVLFLLKSPPTPKEFDELVKLIPPRGSISKHHFVVADRPFELRISRNRMNVVFFSFCVPDGKTTLWSCIRTIQSLTSQRGVWLHWQKFLDHPDMYLT